MSDQNLPSIVCPRCRLRSWHPQDISNRYCGYCKAFHQDMVDVPGVHLAEEMDKITTAIKALVAAQAVLEENARDMADLVILWITFAALARDRADSMAAAHRDAVRVERIDLGGQTGWEVS